MKRVEFTNVTIELLEYIIGNPEVKATRLGGQFHEGKYSCVMTQLTPVGFDIETTKEFMYIWTLSIKDTTIYGYTWRDLIDVLNKLKEACGLGMLKEHSAKVIPIFVHNLGGFEYHFIKTALNITEKCITGKRALYCIVDDSFLFVDSYRIIPMKLEDLAKVYCKTKKTKGLDYAVERNTEDAKNLTEEEIEYCCNDTLILAEFAQYVFDNWVLPFDKFPLTQNQIIKSMIAKEFKNNKEANEALVKELFLDKYEYDLVRRWALRGGWCHTSYKDYKGDIGYGDLSSAYCSAIIKEKFPMSKPLHIPTKHWKMYIDDDHCVVVKICFKNIRPKANNNGWILYDTYTKRVPFTNKEKDRKYKSMTRTNDAGKLKAAPYWTVALTEIDYGLYERIYDWDDEFVLEAVQFKKDYLPDYVIKPAIKLFADKEKLKLAGKEDTAEYKQKKTMPSTIFGAMSQAAYKESLDKNAKGWWKDMKNRKLLPQWGTYITAYVRAKLIIMVMLLGEDIWLYTDTDSIFYIKSLKADKLFKQYNAYEQKRNMAAVERLGLDDEYKDILKSLGTFDDGSKHNLKIDKFKTIAAKSYIYHYTDDKHPLGAYKIVMSGIDKDQYLAYCKKINVDPYDYFENGSEIEYTRHESTIVENTEAIINGKRMFCESGVRIEEVPIKGSLRKIRYEENLNHTMAMISTDKDYNFET